MRDTLKSIVGACGHWVELRAHDRRQLQVMVRKGVLETAASRTHGGVGVRVLANGTWGFSSTASRDRAAIEDAVRSAATAAELSSAERSQRVERLAEAELAVGDFVTREADDLAEHSIEEKTALAVATERAVRDSSKSMRSALARYTEIVDEKWIVSTDGADAHIEDTKPEFLVQAVAGEGDDLTVAWEGSGVTGGWSDLFARRSAEEMGESAARVAVDLLSAPYAPGGPAQVVMDPQLVGLLAHEAIGHTVEADFVLSGSVASGRIGKRVGSDLVTLVDSGAALIGPPNAGGLVVVDDEGVIAGRTVVIDQGVLVSYLHDRESAARFGVEPTGNARAWQYDDPPIIRMRNTYLEPGESTLEEMIASIDDGFLLKRGGSGQADANAEFMFGVHEAYEIRNGKVGRLLRGATISGDAFEVLGSVDMLGSDFEWGVGAGHCGKGQPAKVDGGGPHVRCRVTIGGR